MDNIKIGDEILVSNQWLRKICTIKNITKKIRLSDENLYCKDGHQVGGSNYG